MEYLRFGSKLVVRLDKSEEIVECIKRLCKENNIKLATVSGIGAVNKISIGLFRQTTQEYLTREMSGDMEIASLVGNISQMNGKVYVHLHITVTDSSYQAFGGHLNWGIVGATSEIIIDVIDVEVDREFSKEIGLNLIKLNRTEGN
ncbi:PPC domain-containing DNA-binding protein [Sporomusa sp.]|uniref:PPC domain-containing DNA-binding protein n=1 Tax=Sporomusa sp. TaxID=2078658 RepID=UPI002C34262E|nr:PPC domain-containing DNA-binding protein [Sporomusa sp.]HWR44553.1 PPC domain-containing DNA-binding protein [Sporomusa sp.]